jgi:ABC-type glycerol-3-phosphate transport system substrate-binding protein
MKASKNPDAAWEWIAALMDPDLLERFAQTAAFAPTTKSAANRSSIQQNRYLKLSIDSQPAWGIFPYWHKNWNQVELDTGPSLWQRVLQKELTAQAMLKQLADLMRQV